MRQLTALVLGGVALAAAVQGCSQDPALYLGGPPGPITDLQLSNSKIALAVGESFMIGATGKDVVGNETADTPSFSSCDPSVVSVASGAGDGVFTASATVQATGLGVSCVLVQAGSFTDTVRVTTGPVGVRVVGPDTVGSGNEGTYTIEAFDAAGAALTGTTAYEWKSSNTARLSVNLETGVAQGKGTGAVAVRLFAPGGANALKNLVVVPGVFSGALSATSAAPGALITATRTATGPKMDADVLVRVGTTNAFVDLITPETVTFAVPATGSTAAAVLSLSNMGSAQIAQTTAFTVTAAAADRWQPGNITNDCSDPTSAPAWSTAKSPLGWVYLTHNGTTQGTRGCQNGGAGFDHYFIYTTGAADETVDVLANWTLSGDNDIIICATDYSDCPGFGFSPGTLAELDAVDVDLLASTSYFIIFSPWTGNAGTNNIKITVKKK